MIEYLCEILSRWACIFLFFHPLLPSLFGTHADTAQREQGLWRSPNVGTHSLHLSHSVCAFVMNTFPVGQQQAEMSDVRMSPSFLRTTKFSARTQVCVEATDGKTRERRGGKCIYSVAWARLADSDVFHECVLNLELSQEVISLAQQEAPRWDLPKVKAYLNQKLWSSWIDLFWHLLWTVYKRKKSINHAAQLLRGLTPEFNMKHKKWPKPGLKQDLILDQSSSCCFFSPSSPSYHHFRQIVKFIPLLLYSSRP